MRQHHIRCRFSFTKSEKIRNQNANETGQKFAADEKYPAEMITAICLFLCLRIRRDNDDSSEIQPRAAFLVLNEHARHRLPILFYVNRSFSHPAQVRNWLHKLMKTSTVPTAHREYGLKDSGSVCGISSMKPHTSEASIKQGLLGRSLSRSQL